jgi:hypothetical protein
MQKGFVVGLGLWCWLLGAPTLAAELATLQQSIEAKAAEVDALRGDVAEAERQLAALEAERSQLAGAGDDLAARRSEALRALRAQFEQVVEDPSRPLEAELRAYREAATAQERQRAALARQTEQIAAERERIAALGARADGAGEALVKLRSGFDRARAQRLLREINVMGEQRLTNAITCAPDETIAGCSDRGEQTARRVARTRFADELFAKVTEAEVVARHQVEAGVEPAVVESEILESGFRGQGEYFVTLNARLRTEATLADACRLLGLTDAQCRGDLGAAPARAPAPGSAPGSAVEPEPAAPPEPAVAETPETVLPEEAELAEEDATDEETIIAAAADRFRLTVRSNVYYDEVYIDGVPYGSTKLDVMLPPGEYDVEVRKPGHSPYRERVNLTSSRTLRARLAELSDQ